MGRRLAVGPLVHRCFVGGTKGLRTSDEVQPVFVSTPGLFGGTGLPGDGGSGKCPDVRPDSVARVPRVFGPPLSRSSCVRRKPLPARSLPHSWTKIRCLGSSFSVPRGTDTTGTRRPVGRGDEKLPSGSKTRTGPQEHFLLSISETGQGSTKMSLQNL